MLSSTPLQRGCGWGCLIGSQGDAFQTCTAVLLKCLIAVLGAESLHTACCHHLALQCRAQSLCTWPAQLKHLIWAAICTGNSGLRCSVWGLYTGHPMSKWNQVKHKGKERRKMVRIYYWDSVFISLELLMDFASDSTFLKAPLQRVLVLDSSCLWWCLPWEMVM